MNYYLVTRVWGKRADTSQEYWRFDSAEEADDALFALGGSSVEHEPVDILHVDGTIIGAREGAELYELEAELFHRDPD